MGCGAAGVERGGSRTQARRRAGGNGPMTTAELREQTFFSEGFTALTGDRPFGWQSRLFLKHLARGETRFPSPCTPSSACRCGDTDGPALEGLLRRAQSHEARDRRWRLPAHGWCGRGRVGSSVRQTLGARRHAGPILPWSIWVQHTTERRVHCTALEDGEGDDACRRASPS
jgi:hypothetical protein